MSYPTYSVAVGDDGKPLIWMAGEIKTPPFSSAAGRRCYELRVRDAEQNWRTVSRIDEDAIVIVEVFAKKSSTTPRKTIETCRARLKAYDRLMKDD